jgi:hypothetical protein
MRAMRCIIRALGLCVGVAVALGGAGCRRVPPAARAATGPHAAPAPRAAAPAPAPIAPDADRAGELFALRRRIADVEARVRGLEAGPPARDGGAAPAPAAGAPAPAAPAAPTPAGPPGPAGPTGPEGPAGPALRLDTAPEKGDVYRRRAEQSLEPGETGAAVARCTGENDAVVSGACSVTPAPLGVLAQAGAYGLDDPRLAAGWRCEYRNASPRRAITAHAEVYCVPRKGKAAK